MSNFRVFNKNLKLCVTRRGYPDRTALTFLTQLLVYCGLWNETSSRSYNYYSKIILMFLSFYAMTITYDLSDSSVYTNIVILGDDICVIIGVYLIIFKSFYYVIYHQAFSAIIREMDNVFLKFYQMNNQRVKELMRGYFIIDTVFIFATIIQAVLLHFALTMHPLLSDEEYALPLRAVFPFNHTSNDYGYVFAYVYQTMGNFFALSIIVGIDDIGFTFLNQISLFLEILSIQFSNLGQSDDVSGERDVMGSSAANTNDIHYKLYLIRMRRDLRELILQHQYLIAFVRRFNELLQPMYLAQIIASSLIICFTAFEAISATNKSLFLKFIIFMLGAFTQLLLWCWSANNICCMSTKLSESVLFDNWINTDFEYKRNLMFLIARTQKPIVIRIYNYYPVTMESFLAILSGSYSYFTLLRTLNDK